MSKKADTWMPWYVADYLADTAHLSTEQHGAYCLMLMAAWKRGGSLPRDEAQLAAITRLTPAKWRAHRPVLVEFFSDDGTQLVHSRVTAEREKAQAISDKKAKAGAEGAAKKWQNVGKQDGRPMADAIAHAIEKPWQNDAPSPSPLQLPSVVDQPANAGLSPAEPPTCPHQRLLELFAELVPELPQPRRELWEGGKGAEAMRQRWKWLLSAKRSSDGTRYATNTEEGVDWFRRYFEQVAASDFLTGRNGAWSNCDLTWLLGKENFAKVVQGNYTNKTREAA